MPTLSGVVKDSTNAFAARAVMVYLRSTGKYVGSTVSDATTGAWSITTPYSESHFAVEFNTGTFDPNWDKMVFGLPFSGTNGSTTFTDVKGNTVTPTSTTISTAQSAFAGGQSGLFNGTSSILTLPSSLTPSFNFGTGAFSIRSKFYIAANSAVDDGGNRGAALFQAGYPTSGSIASGWVLSIDGNASTTGIGMTLTAYNSGTATVAKFVTTISQNTWHDIEVGRTSGGNVVMLLDGSVQTLTTNTIGTSGNINAATNGSSIGSIPYVGYLNILNGYIDDMQLYNGVCLHTSGFTPSTTPFIEGMTGGTKNALIYDLLTPV